MFLSRARDVLLEFEKQQGVLRKHIGRINKVKMQTRSDDLIRSDVLFELKWDPKIGSSSDIAVAVKDGVVTLSDSRIAIGTKMQPSRPQSVSMG